MKAIGLTKGGSLLLALNESEARFLGHAVAELQGLATQLPTPVAALKPEPARLPAPRRTPAGRRRAARTRPAGEPKPCVVCGKPFRPTSSQRTCSAECRAKRLATQKVGWRKTRKKSAAAEPGEAGGQWESAADRLTRIREADRKVRGEPAP